MITIKCPICGNVYTTYSECAADGICPNCNWQIDNIEDKDEYSWANGCSFNKAQESFLSVGKIIKYSIETEEEKKARTIGIQERLREIKRKRVV